MVLFDNPGDGHRLHGPLMISDSHGFVPTVIETKEVRPAQTLDGSDMLGLWCGVTGYP